MEFSVMQQQARVPVTVVRVTGNVDSTSYQEFQAYVEQQLANGTKDLLLDLHGVPYMSSAGLRSLNHIYNRLRTSSEDSGAVSKGVTAGTYKSPHLKLLSPTNRVLETLKMSGFDMFLDIESTLGDALAKY